VFVALVIQHAMHMPHAVICGLPRYPKFFHIISRKGKIFGKKKHVTKNKTFVLMFFRTLV